MTEYTEVIQLAKDIAKELGNGWSFKPTEEPYPTQRITGPNEAEISIRIETYGARKGKVEVNGNFHIGRNNEFIDVREWNGSERVSLPSISVTGSRGVAAIVKAIQSRFLPLYLPLLAKAIARRDEHIVYENTVTANLQRLSSAIGTTVPKDDKYRSETRSSVTFSRGETYGTITAHNNSATLELRYLTIEQAENILQLLKEGQ